MCPLLTIANSMNTRDRHCWQWANFTMGPNEQNQHFAGLRQNLFLCIHALVLLRGLPIWKAKANFLWKIEEKAVCQLKSDRIYSTFVEIKGIPTSVLE